MKINTMNYEQLEDELVKERIATCIIYQNGEIKYKYYKNTKSETKLFKVNSVTKSVLSMLIGIAIDKGFIESVKTPISEFFPNIEPNKKELTIEHFLTMTAGYDWQEWGEWGGRPVPMINSEDWVQYVLEKEMVNSPGEKMIYDSGASQVISAIIQIVTKEKLAYFANKMIFEPLEITEFIWHEDSNGINIGGFGLSLKPNDMLKLGILMLQNGKWNNKQIISSDWVSQSTKAKFHTYHHVGSYAYHWWVAENDEPKTVDSSIYFAMGYGGQCIIISPKQQLVAVFTSAKYIETNVPLKIFQKYFQSS
ncbi:serine hydrolase [Bacillus sp. AFS017336]|uniref:serine hydrolase domain-containing protein n=1 Tax=Bacillus sp. AFS017336 TaxID=2033489 RepID=UPI000BF18C7B|nr:serine hydrolase [Bacillus sp. AFS017336]PEL06705.1 6-aminohexanoate hydrolase [Bacillus sp. AFS017336]